jgi:hypothetical protein
MSVDLAPTLLPNSAAIWHGAIENISPYASPCRYMPPSRWASVQESCLDFITWFGTEAHQLGWTVEQLFGEQGTRQVEYRRAAITGRNKKLGVEANRVLYRRTSSYRDRPSEEWGPPIWEFTVKAGWGGFDWSTRRSRSLPHHAHSPHRPDRAGSVRP